ncbi:MAG: DNA mismatch repair endonuclease MutL [Gemmataceae bacterium]|nr:DNA mismatch repair endonuclease MutL [Gemmataceae bacterium]
MPRILQLPPDVVTKIAAGEVIERPGSVVKELVENAIDAGATRIDVEIEAGGAELIRVVDDGHGIEPEDLALALASHATSKLKNADDLFRIGSLGFRGEALASISGVAHVCVQSRAVGHDVGAQIESVGGQLSAVTPWNGSPGTRIEARHLFYNTPVRKKFLKAIPTEVGHIGEQLTRLALAREGLHLTLRHNNKKVIEIPGSATLRDRIRLYFGAEVSDQMYELNAEQGPVRLRGYIVDPACDRGNARLQYLFVNGRWFRDRSLGHAIQEGYRGLLLTGRYAGAFLFLDMPPEQVDVNVHPTKAEVRFTTGNALYHLVLASIRDRLRRANLTPRLVAPPEGARLAPPGYPGMATPRPDWMPLPAPPSVGYQQSTPPAVTLPAAPYSTPPPVTGGTPAETLPASPEFPSGFLLPPIGFGTKAIQLYDAYLVVETDEGMLVIDQHALHERILFEQLRRRIEAGQLERQRLLIPEPIELSTEQAAQVLASREELGQLGVEVEDFGGGTVLLTAYPAILGRISPADIFKEVVDRLTAKDRPPTKDQLLEHLLATMACKAAVKAGDRLTPEEIAELIAQRDLADNSHHCPHGRPTSLVFTRRELDKQFRRT